MNETIKVGSVEIEILEEKNGHRVIWHFGGKRERKFFTDRKQAISFAKKQAVALASPQPTQNIAKDEAELIHYRQLAARLCGTPLHVAVDYFLHHNARQAVTPALTGALLDDFKTRLAEDKKSPSYVKAIEKYCRPFAKRFPGQIHRIASTDVDDWLRRHTKSPHSRWHTARYLKTFFNWCRDTKKALPRGETEADALAFPAPEIAEIEIYTPDEMRRLLAAAQTDFDRALLALGGFAGLRNSEITGEGTDHGALPISAIHFDDAAVKVVQKVRRKAVARYAPLTDNAMSWLLPLRGRDGGVVDFKRADLAIAAIIARANEDKTREPIKFRRNGLRRSHISYRTAIMRDVPRVADECNTSAEKIRSNYRRPGLEKDGHAWYSISRLTSVPAPADLPSIGGATPEARSVES